jgi:hypothetical protein
MARGSLADPVTSRCLELLHRRIAPVDKLKVGFGG